MNNPQNATPKAKPRYVLPPQANPATTEQRTKAEITDSLQLYEEGRRLLAKGEEHEAFMAFSKASDKGHADAMYAMSYMAEMGIGIDKNIDFAMKWYEKAAQSGSVPAMCKMGEIHKSNEWYNKAASSEDAEGIFGLYALKRKKGIKGIIELNKEMKADLKKTVLLGENTIKGRKASKRKWERKVENESILCQKAARMGFPGAAVWFKVVPTLSPEDLSTASLLLGLIGYILTGVMAFMPARNYDMSFSAFFEITFCVVMVLIGVLGLFFGIMSVIKTVGAKKRKLFGIIWGLANTITFAYGLTVAIPFAATHGNYAVFYGHYVYSADGSFLASVMDYFTKLSRGEAVNQPLFIILVIFFVIIAVLLMVPATLAGNQYGSWVAGGGMGGVVGIFISIGIALTVLMFIYFSVFAVYFESPMLKSWTLRADELESHSPRIVLLSENETHMDESFWLDKQEGLLLVFEEGI